MAKHTDEIDTLDNQAKESENIKLHENKTKNNKRKESDMR